MNSRTTSDQDSAATPSVPPQKVVPTPDFSGTPLPIEDVAGQPGFPQSARGAYIDIRGFAGVVVDVVKESIKVRSPDGITQSFNANRLKTLFAPPERYEPPMPTAAEPVQTRAPLKPASPPRVFIADPDFTAPVQPIHDYASQPDFPQCAYGKHVDIGGFAGVVIEIVKGSLKVQPPVGGTRSYNAEVLRKLYSKA
jgi:hypothetical protein